MLLNKVIDIISFQTFLLPKVHTIPLCVTACSISQRAPLSVLVRWRASLSALVLLSPGQTIAPCQCNISQHCWGQHVACDWPPCCDMLWRVRCCWLKFGHFQNLSQQHPTRCNTSQHGGQTNATCCAQQCCDMRLRWHVAIVWPGL